MDVVEGGPPVTYSVALTLRPMANVTITVAGNSQAGASPTRLVFTPANWNTPQTVNVWGVADSLASGRCSPPLRLWQRWLSMPGIAAPFPARFHLRFRCCPVCRGQWALRCNLGRWLTRRTLTLLAIPVLIQFLLVLTNDAHHWAWRSSSLGEYAQPVRGIGLWIMMSYGYLLIMLHVLTLLWLFVRSPLHRRPVGLILISRAATSGIITVLASN